MPTLVSARAVRAVDAFFVDNEHVDLGMTDLHKFKLPRRRKGTWRGRCSFDDLALAALAPLTRRSTSSTRDLRVRQFGEARPATAQAIWTWRTTVQMTGVSA